MPRKSVLESIPAIVWVLITVIAALAMLVGYLLASPREIAAPEQAPSPSAAAPGTNFQKPTTNNALIGAPDKPVTKASDVHRRRADDPFAIGALDAPVVIAEFSDLECPFCSRHANNTEPQIIKNYVDKGLVRLEWNDLPINGPKAVAGAKAGRAAAEQGKFFEFKAAAYAASANVSGHPEHDLEDYMRFAEEAGVPDLKKFKADATSTKYDAAVQDAKLFGSAIGINGTPGFIIGEQFVAGAQPWSVFQQVIEQELQNG